MPIMKPFSNKRGGVLVFFAVALIVLMGMAGLAVDVAHLYGVKSQLQVAADAAALAGANALTGPTAAASAAAEATTVAAANNADADSSGNPVKVSLNSGDISTGNWNGTTFKAGGSPLNAVEVVAKRTGGSGQPMVKNWLIKVLSLLPGGSNFAQTGVSAVAIACRTKLPLVPIAVNEYEGGSYPKSYVRAKNVDGSLDGRGGQTFIFLGNAAHQNCPAPHNDWGFVMLQYRCSHYDGSGNNWYGVTSGNGNCSDPLTGPTGAPNNGAINSQKNTYKGYCINGIPDGMVPPNAIREFYDPNYNPCNTAKQQASYNSSGTSKSPFATVPHFDGNLAGGPSWPIGQKILVMVYDGYDVGNGLEVVTVVGYAVIQVESNGPPTWTGHVIKHGIAGQDDPYIIQPSAANPTPNCADFLINILPELEQRFPVAKLVGSNDSVMHYGMANH